jgi:hypothetical protein
MHKVASSDINQRHPSRNDNTAARLSEEYPWQNPHISKVIQGHAIFQAIERSNRCFGVNLVHLTNLSLFR